MYIINFLNAINKYFYINNNKSKIYENKNEKLIKIHIGGVIKAGAPL